MGSEARLTKWVGRGAALAGAAFTLLAFGALPAAAGTCAAAPPEVLAFSYSTQSAAEQQDDFEDGLIARHWSLKHIATGSYAYSRSIVKEGQEALLITVHHGDKQAEGATDDRCSESAELMEPGY